MEQLNLTTPETKPTNTRYRIERLTIDWTARLLHITLVGLNGETKSYSYSGNIAETFIRILNKTDLSVKSLQRRILEWLVTDGILDGVIAGTPD